MSQQQHPIPSESTTTATTNGAKFYAYPSPPAATYQDLAHSADLFWKNLKAFHKSLGTKFKTPVVGGKTLDLHQLFVEVTTRGGLEQVIRDRKWKEVIVAFKFPTTITSASFVLRKYYLSVLYHFEQVYYFGKQLPSDSKPDNGSRSIASGSTNIEADSSTDQFAGQDLQLGSSVTGFIDGKFDHGYLVTVMLGSEQLQGVLYHMPQMLQVSQGSNISGLAPRRKRRKKIFFGSRDPSQPKEKDITKKIGHLWNNNMTDTEKQVYEEKGYKDEDLRYRNELSTC